MTTDKKGGPDPPDTATERSSAAASSIPRYVPTGNVAYNREALVEILGSEEAADKWIAESRAEDARRTGGDGKNSCFSAENKKNEATVKVVSVADLLAEPVEDEPYLVDGLLPMGGLSALVAKPKVGKSTLARNVGLSVAAGEWVFGRRTTRGPVVYLGLEDKRREVANHFRVMGARTEQLYVHTGPVPPTGVAIMQLQELILQHKAVLAIVDTMLRFVRVRDANDYATMTAALDPLLDLSRETGCHVMLVYHMGKADRDGMDQVLGSTAIGGSVDTLLVLRRDETGIRTLSSIQRYGDDLPEIVVTLNKHTRRVALGGLATERKLQAVEAKVLDAIAKKPLTEVELKEAVGGNKGFVGQVLRSLFKNGRVSRTGTGKKGDPFKYQVLNACFVFPPTGGRNNKTAFTPEVTGQSVSEVEAETYTDTSDIETLDDDPGEREAIQAEAREAEEAARATHRRDSDPPDLIYSFDTGEVVEAVSL